MNNLNIKDPPVCGMNVSKTSKFSKINDKKKNTIFVVKIV